LKLKATQRTPAKRLYKTEHQATILFVCLSQAIQAILQQERPLYLLSLILCHIESSDHKTRTQQLYYMLMISERVVKEEAGKGS